MKHPAQKFAVHNDIIYFAFGPNIQAVQDGKIRFQWKYSQIEDPIPIQHDAKFGSGIRNIIAGHDRIVAVSDDKFLRVFDLELKFLSKRELVKRAVNLCFAPNDCSILIGDKFGDVTRHELNPAEAQPLRLPNEKPLNVGKILLGHVSMLTSLTTSINNKTKQGYIITGDRDEHIRISGYPNTFVIERFLLGHRAYVTALEVVGHLLVSGGGENVVIVWNWETGEELGRIQLVDDEQVAVNRIVAISESEILISIEGGINVFLLNLMNMARKTIGIGTKVLDIKVIKERILVSVDDARILVNLQNIDGKWEVSPVELPLDISYHVAQSAVPLFPLTEIRKRKYED
ncbi:tRNA (guanine-N(7)-)-methyltransferase non-catalytic subunit trm82 [Neolecta irregularis DAH-3]|uniref:tRNA (Guanine-N(7)-)-methyltransferase non-catalytic subunit trm82 n=1 Tax=Neolecta irregularis (strain DAH-3) TaxID=1198029 RepID=A0A1U7LIV3_NEOID|nr:tRNA (guanine-N(7)-)-methyltransferase non-catalytic subunit trm82 [Neolecta irregularis DAH-3]|eukprot:OLL22590.1 tRNA (guanine-N(7)-)-methyltransferase non-catalytic subunit trm82 [Neolecta irregularis DAH-3]